MAYAEVMDAAITQDGADVSLVLVVRSSTSANRAKTLGENFVRMVKNMSQAGPPGRTVLGASGSCFTGSASLATAGGPPVVRQPPPQPKSFAASSAPPPTGSSSHVRSRLDDHSEED